MEGSPSALSYIPQQFIQFFTDKKQSMPSLFPTELNPRKESQIYDDLSTFIQIFKKLITQVELTAINIQKGNEYAYLIERIRGMVEEIDPLMQKYGNDVEPLAVQRMTFHRFVCRLTESINGQRIKYQNVNNIYSVNCFITCLKEIESVIRKYQEERHFGKIVQLSQIIFIKFCMNCQGNVKMATKKNQDHPKLSDTMRKMNEKIGKFKQEKRSHQKSGYELNYSDDSDKEETKTVIEQKKDKIPLISQTLQDIQRRYDVMKGMDLDYSFFKSSYFDAKNNFNYFYKDCVERNTLNLRIITTYHDDFELFLKKKELRFNRRNKRVKTHEFSEKQRDKSVDELMKYKRQENIRIKRNKINQTFDQKSLTEKIFNLKEEPGNVADSNKVSYKMKNVYITLSKKNVKPKNNLSPSILKKKILQTQSNNQAHTTDSIENQKYSTIYLQNRLKNITEERFVQRLKTQAQRPAEEDECKIIEDKVIGFVSSPGKTQIKGKYLEINCIPANKEANSKSRLLLNGVQNKLPVRTEKNRFVIELKQV